MPTAIAGFLSPFFVSAGMSAVAAGVVAEIVSQIVVSVALTVLSLALQKKQNMSGGINTDTTTQGGTTPQKIVLGRYATGGGAIAPLYSFDYNGSSDRKYLTYIIALSDYGTNGVTKYIVDKKEYTIDAAYTAANPSVFGSSLNGILNGHGWVKYYDGSQTSADGFLTGVLGTYQERPWLSTSVLTGVSYSILTFKYNRDKFQSFPELRFEVNGASLYDPRKDSTNGGSGSHRWDNPSTWEFTDNPVVMVYNILRGLRLADGNIYGIGASVESLPNSRWFSAMNKCDEAASEPNATDYFADKKRYRAGIEFSVDDEPLDVIEELLSTCGGQLCEVGGYYIISVGMPDYSVASITDESVIVSEDRSFNVFEGLNSTYNGVHASYPSPYHLWETKDANPYYRADWEAQDDGRRLVADLKLGACPFPKQTRRLMRELAKDNRRERKHVIALGPWSLSIMPLDIISWSSDANGYINKQFEVISKVIDTKTLNCVFTIRERNPADYDADSVFDSVIPAVPSIAPVRSNITGVDGLSVATQAITDNGGNIRRSAIRIDWNGSNSYDSISYEVKLKTSSQVVKSGSITDIRAGSFIVSGDLLPNTQYSVRAKGIVRGRNSDWSSYINVTTPQTYISNDDFANGVDDFLTSVGIHAPASGYTLPSSGSVDGEQFFNRTDGVTYSWNSTLGIWQPYVQRQIAGTLDASAFAANIAIPRIVSTLPATGTNGSLVVLSSNSQLYRWNGSAWSNEVSANLVVGQLTAGQIGAGAVGADQVAAKEVAAKLVTIVDWENYLTDGKMLDASQWVFGANTVLNANTVTSSTYGFKNGGFIAWTMPDTAPTGLFNMASTRQFSVDVGAEYSVSVNVRRRIGLVGGFKVRAQYYDSSNTSIGYFDTDINLTSLSGTVETYTASFTPIANTVNARIVFLAQRTGTDAGAQILIGDASVRRKNGGELIVDGSITGNLVAANTIQTRHLDVGFLRGERVSATYLDVDALLTIGNGAGLSYGKTSVSDDGMDGLYFGVDSANSATRFGFSASRTSVDNKRQQLKLSSTSGFQILNAKHYVSGATLPVTVTKTANVAKSALPAGITSISLNLNGGGAAGWSLSSYTFGFTGFGSSVAGGAGGDTIVKIYEGTTLKHTFIASGGGAGGVYGNTVDYTKGSPSYIAAGQNNSNGPSGGAGGSVMYDKEGTIYYISSSGGLAGAAVSVDEIDLSGYTNPQIEITIGSGGVATTTSLGTVGKGSNGLAGKVAYTYKTAKDISADVVPLTPTATGSFTVTAGVAGSFPALGAGLWIIYTTDNSNLYIGNVSPTSGRTLFVGQSNHVSFVSDKTPTYSAATNTRTINYIFHSMGSWG